MNEKRNKGKIYDGLDSVAKAFPCIADSFIVRFFYSVFSVGCLPIIIIEVRINQSKCWI